MTIHEQSTQTRMQYKDKHLDLICKWIWYNEQIDLLEAADESLTKAHGSSCDIKNRIEEMRLERAKIKDAVDKSLDAMLELSQ